MQYQDEVYLCLSHNSFPGPASTDGSKALPCFHQVWLKGTTCLSLSANEPTDNGFCYHSFSPLELLPAGRMLETGAGLGGGGIPHTQKSPGQPEVSNPEEV